MCNQHTVDKVMYNFHTLPNIKVMKKDRSLPGDMKKGMCLVVPLCRTTYFQWLYLTCLKVNLRSGKLKLIITYHLLTEGEVITGKSQTKVLMYMYWSTHQGQGLRLPCKNWTDKVNKLFIVWHFHCRPESAINELYTWACVILHVYPWLKCPLQKVFIKPFSLGNFAWKSFQKLIQSLSGHTEPKLHKMPFSGWALRGLLIIYRLKQNFSFPSLRMHRSPLLTFLLPPVFFRFSWAFFFSFAGHLLAFILVMKVSGKLLVSQDLMEGRTSG